MKKKLLMIVMAMVLCFALAACGGGGDKEKDDGIDPNATVTKEQYDKLGDSCLLYTSETVNWRTATSARTVRRSFLRGLTTEDTVRWKR